MPAGMDRSTPAVMMTNVVPTLTTVRMATFWAIWRKLSPWKNSDGSATVKPRMMTTSTAKVTTVGLRSTARSGLSGLVSGSSVGTATGLVSVLTPPPPPRC